MIRSQRSDGALATGSSLTKEAVESLSRVLAGAGFIGDDEEDTAVGPSGTESSNRSSSNQSTSMSVSTTSTSGFEGGNIGAPPHRRRIQPRHPRPRFAAEDASSLSPVVTQHFDLSGAGVGDRGAALGAGSDSDSDRSSGLGPGSGSGSSSVHYTNGHMGLHRPVPPLNIVPNATASRGPAVFGTQAELARVRARRNTSQLRLRTPIPGLQSSAHLREKLDVEAHVAGVEDRLRGLEWDINASDRADFLRLVHGEVVYAAAGADRLVACESITEAHLLCFAADADRIKRNAAASSELVVTPRASLRNRLVADFDGELHQDVVDAIRSGQLGKDRAELTRLHERFQSRRGQLEVWRLGIAFPGIGFDQVERVWDATSRNVYAAANALQGLAGVQEQDHVPNASASSSDLWSETSAAADSVSSSFAWSSVARTEAAAAAPRAPVAPSARRRRYATVDDARLSIRGAVNGVIGFNQALIVDFSSASGAPFRQGSEISVCLDTPAHPGENMVLVDTLDIGGTDGQIVPFAFIEDVNRVIVVLSVATDPSASRSSISDGSVSGASSSVATTTTTAAATAASMVGVGFPVRHRNTRTVVPAAICEVNVGPRMLFHSVQVAPHGAAIHATISMPIEAAGNRSWGIGCYYLGDDYDPDAHTTVDRSNANPNVTMVSNTPSVLEHGKYYHAIHPPAVDDACVVDVGESTYTFQVKLPACGPRWHELRGFASGCKSFCLDWLLTPGKWFGNRLRSISTARIDVPAVARVVVNDHLDHETVSGTAYITDRTVRARRSQPCWVSLHYPSPGGRYRPDGRRGAACTLARAAEARFSIKCTELTTFVVCLWSPDGELLHTSPNFTFRGWANA